MKNIKILNTITILAFFFINSCSPKNQNEEVFKKKRAEQNVYERAASNAEKNTIIFGNFGKKTEGLENKILWKSTIESLDFMPLTSSDFGGGMIITDWYSSKNTNEEIKLTVVFNSYEIKSDSIEIRGFKRVCKNQKCEINEVDKDFADQIKINILEKARKNNLKK